MQETTYSYTIIIADDCSTDKTLEIAEEYRKAYPHIITIMTSEKNQKIYKNTLRAYTTITTKYFCVLDPDDFWIDTKKIQKALDFLETNRDYTIYTGNTQVQYQDKGVQNYIGCNESKTSTFLDYLKSQSIAGHTSSCVFRNIVFNNNGGGGDSLINYYILKLQVKNDLLKVIHFAILSIYMKESNIIVQKSIAYIAYMKLAFGHLCLIYNI